MSRPERIAADLNNTAMFFYRLLNTWAMGGSGRKQETPLSPTNSGGAHDTLKHARHAYALPCTI